MCSNFNTFFKAIKTVQSTATQYKWAVEIILFSIELESPHLSTKRPFEWLRRHLARYLYPALFAKGNVYETICLKKYFLLV